MAKNRLTRNARQLWWFLPLLAAVFLLINSPWFLKKFYPLPYRDLIMMRSLEAGLDPLLVASVIREESRFNPEARSPKGAVGLMQVMPETGRWAAGRMDLKGFKPDMLLDADFNLRIGCWYLNSLEEEFRGNWLLVLAAYNAGRGNVQQWLAAGIWDGSWEDLDGIPFYQTRSYIRKVVMTYSTYQRLYRTEVGGTPVEVVEK